MKTQLATNTNTTLSPIQKFENTLKGYESTILSLLESRGISAKEFMIIALTAVKKTPKLLECDPKSLFASILTAAELGLRPNTPMQHCYLIPYGNECQFQVGYHGLVHLLYQNSGITVDAELICKNDEFDYEKGLAPKLYHKPAKGLRGDALGAYAIFRLPSGETRFEVIWEEDVAKIKKMSKNPSLYTDAKDPMKWSWKKFVVKQGSKLLPKTAETAKAVHIDNIIETGGRLTLKEDNGSVEVVEIEGKPVASAEDVATDIFADDNE